MVIKMFQLIKNYIDKMTIFDLDNIAKKNDIFFSKEELEYTYNFLKRNFEALYANPNLDLSRIKSHFSEENYTKLQKKLFDFKTKYSDYFI